MQKGMFYAMFAITILIIFTFLKMSVSIFLAPYGKKSEILALLACSLLLAAGLYITYNIIKNSERYAYACGALGITWAITLATFIIGVMLFSDPFKWH